MYIRGFDVSFSFFIELVFGFNKIWSLEEELALKLLEYA